MFRAFIRLGLAAALGGLICALLYQGEKIRRLQTMLQERPERPTILLDQTNGPVTSVPKDNSSLNSIGSITADPSRELLRLRGEVSVLKRQLAERLDRTSKDQEQHQLARSQTVSWTESDLNDQQRKSLADWTEKLKTGNSVTDLARLKDSLDRWEELMVNPAPPEQKPVLAILKERLKERIAELESQK
jgi:hypothetical protein